MHAAQRLTLSTRGFFMNDPTAALLLGQGFLSWQVSKTNPSVCWLVRPPFARVSLPGLPGRRATSSTS